MSSTMAYAALGITNPLGMLARLSRRRLLYLPINGLQRLAIWGWVYRVRGFIERL